MFQERTIYDLLVEYHLDVYDNNPLEVHRQADGEIVLTDTGDPLIDKWEQAIAKGEEPDLREAFSDEDWAVIERLQKKASNGIGLSGTLTMGDIQEVMGRAKKNPKLLPPTQELMQSMGFNTFGSDDR